jgi:hypothetical protein
VRLDDPAGIAAVRFHRDGFPAADGRQASKRADPGAHPATAGQGLRPRRRCPRLSAKAPASRVIPLRRRAPPSPRPRAPSGPHRGPTSAASPAKGNSHDDETSQHRRDRQRRPRRAAVAPALERRQHGRTRDAPAAPQGHSISGHQHDHAVDGRGDERLRLAPLVHLPSGERTRRQRAQGRAWRAGRLCRPHHPL